MGVTVSYIRYYDLLKSFMIFFVIQAILVIVFFWPIWYAEITYRFLIFFINIVVSSIFGWRLYWRRYHMVFAYDQEGFTLKQGNREKIVHKWSEFSRVSLFRTEQGNFFVRLYKNDEFFDLPASKLKLNPFGFRLETMKLIEAKGEKRR